MAAVRSCFCCFRNVKYLSRLGLRIYSDTGGRSYHILSSRLIFPAYRTRYLYFAHKNYAIKSLQNINIVNESSDASKTQSDTPANSLMNKSDKEKGDGGQKKEGMFSGKNAWKFGLVALGAWVSLSVGLLFWTKGAPLEDEEGNEIRDEYSDYPTVSAYIYRGMNEMNLFRKMIQDPISQKLLPDPLQEPYYQPPYTLVIEMTGILVHPDWDYGTGWRFQKRPALDYFLQQCGPPLFEIVIYTAEPGHMAFPLIDNIDPNGYVMYRLFRDATRYQESDGHHVKDLECLNRDLSKVIIVDWDPKSYQLQPRNAIGVKKWSGQAGDRQLVDLAALLRTIATSGVDDVRPVLDYYKQFDDPVEAFRENQRKVQEEQTRQVQLNTEKKKSDSFLSSLRSRRL